MSFGLPLFLIAGLAAVIPVILHMINRQQAKNLPFPTLRFLIVSSQKTRRRKQIHDVLLMLIRIAALVLVAIGLSKPTLTNLKTLFGSGAVTAMAIVLDNSASMGVIDADKERFETAKGAVNQILDQVQDGDQVALFVPCGKPFELQGRLERNYGEIRQMVANARVSYQRADVAAKVLEARKTLAKSEAPNKQVFVVSDMQASAWESLKKEVEDAAQAKEGKNAAVSPEEQKLLDIPLIFVDVNRLPRPNVAIQSIEAEAAVPVAGLPVKATVELYNASPQPQPASIELYIDGKKDSVSPTLTVQGESTLKHEMIFRFKQGGLHKGEARLVRTNDGSTLDNRRFFTMEVDQGIPIAIVKTAKHDIPYLDDAHYLETALAPGRSGSAALKVTTLMASQLSGEPLDNYKVIWLLNVKAVDDETAKRLRNYVERGGHLIWVAGDNVAPEEYNAMNQQADGRLLPLPLLDLRAPAPGDARDSFRITFLDKTHRALAQVAEPASLYQNVLIYKHLRMDGSQKGQASILARLDDGEPLLAEKKVEKGSVLYLGTSLQIAWTNLPLRQIFVPMLSQLVFVLSGAEQSSREGLAGAPLVLQFDKQVRPSGVEIVPPSGETIRREVGDAKAESADEFRFADTQDIGVYLVRLLQTAGAKQIGYSVNVDPQEAEPQKIKREELQELFGRTPLVFAEDPDNLASTFEWLRQGRSLWGTFLVGVLIVLVCETFVSNTLSPKQEDAELQKLPPGMRRLAKKSRVDLARGTIS